MGRAQLEMIAVSILHLTSRSEGRRQAEVRHLVQENRLGLTDLLIVLSLMNRRLERQGQLEREPAGR